jgi:DNA polymerase-3 subunit epsilon
VNQIEWRAHGFEGLRLGHLLNCIGMFHRSHRAVDDCHALLEILAHTIPSADRTALSFLLENARRKTIRIWAEQAPFDLKDELKSAAIAGALAMRAAQRPGMSISMKPNETARSPT